MTDSGEVDNVLVAVRIRPRIMSAVNISQTAERHLPTAASRVGDDTIRMTEAKPPGSQIGLPAAATNAANGATDVKTQNFTFDAVFDEDATQEDLYNETTLAAVDAALEGRNATIMTYGQTGSGKTFTVLGAVSQNPLDGDDVVVRDTGLFLRVLRDVLTYRRKRSGNCHVVVAISVIEIYLDNVRDLLGKDATANLRVAINSDSVDMPDLTIEQIEHLRDAVNCYKKATGRRVSRATDANDQSSRSHALFSIEIFQQERGENNPLPLSVAELQAAKEKNKSKAAAGQPFGCGRQGFPPVRHSRIVLTDLAGSEKMKTANAKGEALEEMKKINGSLTCLGNVVHSLYSGAKHIPYRDSKLTIILRASFSSPKAHVVLIANVAPTTLTFDETLSTLFFANKVKAMKANVGGAGAQDVMLENEYMLSAKACEEICADLRIAREVNDPFVVFPSGMHPASGPRRVLAVPRGSRQASLAAAIAQLSQTARRSREASAQQEGSSTDEAVSQRAMQKSSELVNRRKDYNSRIETAIEELANARRIAAEWAANDAAALAAAATASQQSEASLVKLKETAAAHRAAIAEQDASLEGMKAAIAKIEADFRATHAAEFARFDAEDRAFASSDAFHHARRELIDKRIRSRQVHTEYVELAAQTARGFIESFDAERDFRRVGIYEWLRPAVVNMAANAVVMSIRNHFTAPRRAPTKMPPAAAAAPNGEGGAAAPAPKVPKMLPSGQALRPAQHADPNAPPEAGGASPAPRAPSKVPPRAPQRPDGSPALAPPAPPLEVAPLTVFDSETLARDVINYIGAGANLLKHGRSGRPHLRFVYGAAIPPTPDLALSDPANVRLYYCEDRAMKGASGLLSVPISSVQAVTLGQCTPVFQRSKRRDDYYFSFSVHYIQNQEPRTLDLVASNEPEYEAWVMGICAMAKVNPAFGEPKAELERLPPPHVLTDVEEALCRDWHIRPQLLVTVREKLEELRRRRDAPNIRLTPGGMRFISNVDVFRANMLWRYFLSEGFIAPTTRGVLQYLEYDEPQSPLQAAPAAAAKSVASPSAASH